MKTIIIIILIINAIIILYQEVMLCNREKELDVFKREYENCYNAYIIYKNWYDENKEVIKK